MCEYKTSNAANLQQHKKSLHDITRSVIIVKGETRNKQNEMLRKKVQEKIKSVTCVNRKQAMQQAYSDT